MDIREVKETKCGHPWRFYADDGGGDFPIHGAYYFNGIWWTNSWSITGKFSLNGNSHLDLNFTDWKREIPWDRLIENIEWVTWDKVCKWRGWSSEPNNPPKLTDAYWHLIKGQGWDLSCLEMPNPPSDWKRAIARRSKNDSMLLG